NLVQYQAVSTTVVSSPTSTRRPVHRGTCASRNDPSATFHAWSMITSLEKNPENGGTPARAASPIDMQMKVTGMVRRRPPIRVIELVPTAWITQPAARNSSALKAAWVSRWNSAVPGNPTANPANMNATWLTVLQASTRLMSSWAVAASAASSMVTTAITAIVVITAVDEWKIGNSRASTITPAATIVAA